MLINKPHVNLSKGNKKLLKFLGPALYAFFLVKFVDPFLVFNVLTKIRFDIIFLSVAAFPVLTAVFTVKWWIICQNIGMQSSLKQLSNIYYASWALGILPLSGLTGIAKIFYLRDSGEKISKAAVSIAIDKFFDIFGLLLFGIIGFLYLPSGFLDTHILLLTWGTAFALCIIALCFGRHFLPQFHICFRRYLNKRLKNFGVNFETVFFDLGEGINPKAAVFQLILATAINLLRSLILYLLAISLGLNVLFMQMLTCRALIGLINTIPISINGLGTRDAVLLLILPIWGISNESALALGSTAFIWTIVTQAVSASFWIWFPFPFDAFAETKRKLFQNNEKKSCR